MMNLTKRLAAEAIGTFWLVLGGVGSAVLAGAFPGLGIGFAGIAFAFGLTVLGMAYAFGHVSGGHFNPAVTAGLAAAGRFPGRDVAGYIVAQVVGAILAASVLVIIARGAPGFDVSAGFGTNGYGPASPGGYSLVSALVCEIVMTAAFLTVIIGSTSDAAPKGFAPLAIGLTLTVIHLVSIPVTGTSVNPARSTGPALIAGGLALRQLWAFWVAPLAGALLAGWGYRVFHGLPSGELDPGARVARPASASGY